MVIKKLSFFKVPIRLWALLFFSPQSCVLSFDVPNPNSTNQIINVSANVALSESTKTIITGTTHSWSSYDCIGVFVEGLHNNVQFVNNPETGFNGHFMRKSINPSIRNVFAYYPYLPDYSINSYVITTYFPIVQKAPFDPQADVIVAESTTVSYNEDQMPKLNICFAHHLFSILKIDITNSDPNLQNDQLLSVKVSSSSRVLSGKYSFDVSEGINAEAVFSADSNDVFKSVRVDYNKSEILGLNSVHSIYVVIPQGIYPESDLSFLICTNKRTFSLKTSVEMEIRSDTIYQLEPIDLATKTASEGRKTILCFGDSITPRTMTEQLQQLLGYEWEVHLAGVSSENVMQILARQGGVPLYLRGGFKIPESSKIGVDVGNSFYTTYHPDGSVSSVPDNPLLVNLYETTVNNNPSCGLANPFQIGGVECKITRIDNTLYLTRTSDGPEVDLKNESYVLVKPYAVWKYGNPTVTTVYMGTNGQYVANESLGLLTNDDTLVYFYKLAEKSTTGKFIAVGYQHHAWNESYKLTMTNAFQDNYLDLRTYGVQYAKNISPKLGIKTMTDKDLDNLSKNLWPHSWSGVDNVHPNDFGYRAYAYLIYYKMKDLGYVE